MLHSVVYIWEHEVLETGRNKPLQSHRALVEKYSGSNLNLDWKKTQSLSVGPFYSRPT